MSQKRFLEAYGMEYREVAEVGNPHAPDRQPLVRRDVELGDL